MPRASSAATVVATSACTCAAIFTPSSSLSPDAVDCRDSTVTPGLPGKVHRPRLANQHNLDLSRILQLRFDAPSDLLGHGGHANVVHVVGCDDHADFA